MTARDWFGSRATQVIKTFASHTKEACSKRLLQQLQYFARIGKIFLASTVHHCDA
jgi:hypothetical protein